MRSPPEQAESGPDWHPAVPHACRVDESDGAIHVVVRPAGPGETPVRDIRDAGYEVLAYGLPLDNPPCDAVDDYLHCQQLLVTGRDRTSAGVGDNGQSRCGDPRDASHGGDEG